MRSLLPRRSRLVTFRVSEDEYQELRKTCEVTRARSLSDLTRAAVARMMTPAPSSEGGLEDRVRVLEEAVRQISSHLDGIAARR